MQEPLWIWLTFITFVLVMLTLDLTVFHRKAHTIAFREALGWSAFWISLALIFNVGLWYFRGRTTALNFLTGYLIEQSLSVDNLFVFLMIFSYFKVPAIYQHRVLFWGILGVLVMRGIFIYLGVTIIERFEWSIYVFGAILVFTGIKMATQKEREIHPERNPVLGLVRRIFPVTPEYVGGKFFVRREGRLWATPLFIVLMIVETTDLVFAVDSVPAVLAITTDPFIVFTSNVFAILGLRSYYFALAGLLTLFHHLHYGLSLILIFVGSKMLLSHHYHMDVTIALGVVAGILVLSVLASIIWPSKESEVVPNPEVIPANPEAPEH